MPNPGWQRRDFGKRETCHTQERHRPSAERKKQLLEPDLVNCSSPCCTPFNSKATTHVPSVSSVFHEWSLGLRLRISLVPNARASQIKLADLGSCRGIYSRQPFTEPRLSFSVCGFRHWGRDHKPPQAPNLKKLLPCGPKAKLPATLRQSDCRSQLHAGVSAAARPVLRCT